MQNKRKQQHHGSTITGIFHTSSPGMENKSVPQEKSLNLPLGSLTVPKTKPTKPRTQSHERETGLQRQNCGYFCIRCLAATFPQCQKCSAGWEIVFRVFQQRLVIKPNQRITAEQEIALKKPSLASLLAQ